MYMENARILFTIKTEIAKERETERERERERERESERGEMICS